MMSVELRDTEVPSVPSVYFAKAYGAALAKESGSTWVSLIGENLKWQIPLLLTSVPHGEGLEATSPYGYSGVYVSAELDDAQVQELWSQSVELLRKHNVVSLFLRFSPFDLTSANRARSLPQLKVRHLSDTITVPVKDEKSLWDGMKGRARTAVRKSELAGLTASVRPVAVADIEDGSPFRRLYAATMRRVEAADQHLHSETYYRDLLSELGEAMRIATVADVDGEVAAAALLFLDASGVHYHLSGSDPVFAKAGANNLMLWEVLRSSAVEGNSLVHLGGGLSAGDNLFKFKESFGGNVTPFHVGTHIVNQKRYDDLAAAQADELGVSVGDLLAADYFPAFRAVVRS